MRFKLEKGIEIHPFFLERRNKHLTSISKGKSKYPFKEMEIGDSFLIPPDIKIPTIRMAALTYGYRYKRQFVVTHDIEMKLRCWRIG